MRIQPLPNEAPAAFETRRWNASTASRNYGVLTNFERELGVAQRPAPRFERFGTHRHPRFESPLVGPGSADLLAKFDYFSWQAIKDLPTWGSIVVEPNVRSLPGSTTWSDDGGVDAGEVVSPVPIEAPQARTLRMRWAIGPRLGEIIGKASRGTHSWTSSPDNWQSDNAIDIELPMRTPVYAIGSGVISRSHGFGDTDMGGRFEGKRLHLEYSNNVAYYAHLSEIVVSPGQRVSSGQLLGYSGSVSGIPHLHFALKHSDPLWLVANARRQQPY